MSDNLALLNMSLSFFVPLSPKGAMWSPSRQCRKINRGFSSRIFASKYAMFVDFDGANSLGFINDTSKFIGVVTACDKSILYSSLVRLKELISDN